MSQRQIRWTHGIVVHTEVNEAILTAQSIRINHLVGRRNDSEVLIVDNCPGSAGSAHLASWCRSANVRYIPQESPVGTAVAKNRVFAEARGERVSCRDGHVFEKPDTWERMDRWFDRHPGCMDLLHGPLLRDSLQGFVGTHMADVWRGQMRGIWTQAWMTRDSQRFQILKAGDSALAVTLDSPHRELPGMAPIPFDGHERALIARGCVPLGLDPHDEVDVPGTGGWMIVCRKDGWLGFNPEFRGFGGEETYLQQKYRKAGRRAIVLGCLQTWHMFRDTKAKSPYPNTVYDHVRNAVLGAMELGEPLDRIEEHFVGGKIMRREKFEEIVANPYEHPKFVMQDDGTPPVAPPITEAAVNPLAAVKPIGELLDEVVARGGEIAPHLVPLRNVASTCHSVAEISSHPETFVALCAGMSPVVRSFNLGAEDTICRQAIAAARSGRDVTITKADPEAKALQVPVSDLVLLDVSPVVLMRDLMLIQQRCRRYLVIYGTLRPHMIDILRVFMDRHPQWFIAGQVTHEPWLTVLGCQPEDRPKERICLWPVGHGPGSVMKKKLESVGVFPRKKRCTCNALAAWMDCQGPDGCAAFKETIRDKIEKNKANWGWDKPADQDDQEPGDGVVDYSIHDLRPEEEAADEPHGVMDHVVRGARLATVAAKAFAKLHLDPRDPIGDLIDKSIAEARENLT